MGEEGAGWGAGWDRKSCRGGEWEAGGGKAGLACSCSLARLKAASKRASVSASSRSPWVCGVRPDVGRETPAGVAGKDFVSEEDLAQHPMRTVAEENFHMWEP